MSVYKTEIRKCDVCGKDITRDIIRYSFKQKFGSSKYKEDMCNECFKEFKKLMREKRTGGKK